MAVCIQKCQWEQNLNFLFTCIHISFTGVSNREHPGHILNFLHHSCPPPPPQTLSLNIHVSSLNCKPFILAVSSVSLYKHCPIEYFKGCAYFVEWYRKVGRGKVVAHLRLLRQLYKVALVLFNGINQVWD